IETDMAVHQTQEVVFRDVIFQTEVVKQGFGTGVLPHHDQQASENGDPAQHAQHSYCLYRNSPADHRYFFNTHRRLHNQSWPQGLRRGLLVQWRYCNSYRLSPETEQCCRRVWFGSSGTSGRIDPLAESGKGCGGENADSNTRPNSPRIAARTLYRHHRLSLQLQSPIAGYTVVTGV